MKTHELAAFLKELAEALGQLPDMELTSLPEILKGAAVYPAALIPVEEPKRTLGKVTPEDDIQRTLAKLSKREMLQLLDRANVRIRIRSKDSTNDAAKKIKAHLLKYPASAKQIQIALGKERSGLISQPLSKALETLLGN